MKKTLKTGGRGASVGFIIGVILVVVNTLAAGFPFMMVLIPITYLVPDQLMRDLGLYYTGPFGCSGEECWGAMILFGDLVIFFLSPIIGMIMAFVMQSMVQRGKEKRELSKSAKYIEEKKVSQTANKDALKAFVPKYWWLIFLVPLIILAVIIASSFREDKLDREALYRKIRGEENFYNLVLDKGEESDIYVVPTKMAEDNYISTDSDFVITVNKEIDGGKAANISIRYSLKNSGLKVNNNEIKVDQSIVNTGENLSVRLHPADKLHPNTSYKVEVSLYAKDSDKYSVASWVYKTTPNLFLGDTIPADGSTSVEIPEEIKLTFSTGEFDKTEFEEHLSITPDIGYEVESEGSIVLLKFSNKPKAGTEYRLELDEELQSTSGTQLDKPYEIEFTTEGADKRFRWRGSQNPETFFGGLHIDTVSSGPVDYSIYKTSGEANGNPAKMDELIKSENLPFDQPFVVEELPIGVYLVNAVSGGSKISKEIFVSNLAPFVKTYRNTHEGWVFEAVNRLPIQVEVECYKDGELLFSTTTDQDGHFKSEVCQLILFRDGKDVAVYSNPKLYIPTGAEDSFEFDRKEAVIRFYQTEIYAPLEREMAFRRAFAPYDEDFYHLQGLYEDDESIPLREYFGRFGNSLERLSEIPQKIDVSKDIVPIPDNKKNPLYFSFGVGDQLLGPEKVRLKEAVRDWGEVKIRIMSVSEEGREYTSGQKAHPHGSTVTLRYSYYDSVSPVFRVYRKESYSGEYILEHEETFGPQEKTIENEVTYTPKSVDIDYPYTYYIFEIEAKDRESDRRYVDFLEYRVHNDQEKFFNLIREHTYGSNKVVPAGSPYDFRYSYAAPDRDVEITLVRNELVGFNSAYGYAYLKEIGRRDVDRYNTLYYPLLSGEKKLSEKPYASYDFIVPNMEPGVYDTIYKYDKFEEKVPSVLYVPEPPSTNIVSEDIDFTYNLISSNDGSYYMEIQKEKLGSPLMRHYRNGFSVGRNGEPSFDYKVHSYKVFTPDEDLEEIIRDDGSGSRSPLGYFNCYYDFDDVNKQILWKEMCQYIRN